MLFAHQVNVVTYFVKSETAEVVEVLPNNEIYTVHCLNQEMNLKRFEDTCWSFHYGVVVNLIHMFLFVINVIECIMKDDLYYE